MDTDLISEIGGLLGSSDNTTTVSTTAPSDAVNPVVVIVGSLILIGVLGFLIYKFA